MHIARGVTAVPARMPTLMYMASIPFTLAALATSAVPGLVVLGARQHEEDEAFVSAIVFDGTDEFIVRVPRTQTAEVQQSAELLGLAALTEGSREALPFTIPESLGMTRAGDTRAVVTTYVDGGRFDAEDLSAESLLILPCPGPSPTRVVSPFVLRRISDCKLPDSSTGQKRLGSCLRRS